MENQVTRVMKLYEDLGLAEKSLAEMSLAEKGILLQLNLGNPFDGETLPLPDASMSPEDKGGLLLAYVFNGQKAYVEQFVNDAKFGEEIIKTVPLDFSGANLHVLGLMNSDLSKANLRGAAAREANLIGVDLSGANLEDAQLEGTHLSDARLLGCRLRNVQGFPYGVNNAVVDVATYNASEWTPEELALWRSCGLKILALDEFPHDAIDAVLGDVSRVLSSDVFISYGGCDSNAAMHIATHLEKRGTRVWFAAWDIDYGDDVVTKIEEGISNTRAFLIVLSPEALERPWVRQELSTAFHHALSHGGKKIIPVMYKPCEPPPFLGTRKWLEMKKPYLNMLEDLVRLLRNEPIRRDWQY